MSIRCDGARAGLRLRCNGSLYRCTACGHEGCTHNKPALCTNQGFEVDAQCVKCGAVGRRELLAADRVGLFGTLMHDPN